MIYGLKMLNDSYFEIDGESHRIPDPEIDFFEDFTPHDEPYRETFPRHATEPAAAHVALEPFYVEADQRLASIKRTIEKASPDIYKLRQELQAPEAARLIAKDVNRYLELVEEARQMASNGLEFVDTVRDRATRHLKPKDELESTLRAIENQTLRQEIAAIPKQYGKTDAERTSRALRLVGKGNNLERDLNLLEAVQSNTTFEVSEGALGMAKERLIETHYPWIADLKKQKELIDKWVQNRTSLEAMPALRKVLPFNLTPEDIQEMAQAA